MDIKEIMSQLKAKFGDSVDLSKVENLLKNHDLKNLSFSEIVQKIKDGGLLGDLDGDGKVESTFEEIKGKIGGLFGKK